MSEVEILPVTREHVAELAKTMRSEEVEEIKLTSRTDPANALTRSLEKSSEAFVAVINGDLCCMSGVAPYTVLSTTASPWLLTSRHMAKYPKELLRYTKIALEGWRYDYALLENYVDARYGAALRWAKWAGFTVDPVQEYGITRARLCRIWMEGY